MYEASELQSLSFNLINADSVCLGSEWRYTDTYNSFNRLYLIKKGEGILYHHDKEFLLKKGILHFIPRFTRLSCRCESFLEIAYAHFACEMTGHFDFFSDYQFNYQVEASQMDYFLIDRFLEINPGMGLKENDPDKYDRELQMRRAENYIEDVSQSTFIESKGIILQLLSRFMPLDIKSGTAKGHDDYHTIEDAIRFIRENIDKPMSVRELADYSSLNEDYFSRIFLKVMGTRPIEYIHRMRVQRAKLLFLTTNMSLEQVAHRSGFSSGRYLSRIFRKYTDVKPTEYRKAAHYC